MTHSAGQGEIIGKVAGEALSMKERARAGAWQDLGAGEGCEGVSRLGASSRMGAAAAFWLCCLQPPRSVERAAPAELPAGEQAAEAGAGGAEGEGWQSCPS